MRSRRCSALIDMGMQSTYIGTGMLLAKLAHLPTTVHSVLM